jgi:dihydroorotate dehydrogenase (fumarate)
MSAAETAGDKESVMDMRTSYLGLTLEHPFIAGASPFGYHLDTIKRLEDAGCAAVVLHSLFEEQITYAHSGHVAHLDAFAPESHETVSAFPLPADYPLGPDEYAEHIAAAKRAARIPVIGSLNGRAPESWLKFARVIEQAGADALELNIYDVPADLNASAAAIEDRLIAVVKDLKRHLKIPLAVKLTPFFTALGSFARQLDAAGADGLVLFNRFYQPDIDIRTMTLVPEAQLSTSAELLLRLRWVAILHGRIRPSIALTGGVSTPDDGIKAVLAGADVVQLVSALLRHGPSHLAAMRDGLSRWMAWHHFDRLDEARGRASLRGVGDRELFERAYYIRTLHSWTA